MKKLCAMVMAAAVLATAAFTQEGKKWYNSYAPGIEGAKLFINAGIGAGIFPYATSLPPISASVEYALPNVPCLSAGISVLPDTKKKSTLDGTPPHTKGISKNSGIVFARCVYLSCIASLYIVKDCNATSLDDR